MKRLLSLLVVLSLFSPALGSDWPNWRGPNYNGSSDETNLPSRFSKTENVVWKAELPGVGAASPIVSGDRVFVSSTDASGETLKAICFRAKDGKLVWQHSVGDKIRQDIRSTYAAPSPVTDGKLVVFFYGTGDLVAFRMDGKRLWEKNLQKEYGPFAFQWTFSTSPVLYDGKLFMQVLQRDVPARGRGRADRFNESYLLALNPETGEELWRQVRNSDAVMESREAFTTPIPFEHDGRKELLIAGGDDLTGHDPATGEELWRWGTWNPTRIGHWRLVPSPVASENTILVCAPKRDPIYAIRAGGNGELNDDAVAWVTDEVRELSSDVPTPAFYDGDFFVLSDLQRSLSRVDPNTGKARWTMTTPGRNRDEKYEASPLLADGKVYLINFRGDVTVVDAANGKIINTVAMGESGDDKTRSSIAVADGRLYIRTNKTLYCVGKP